MKVTFVEVGGYRGTHTATALRDNPEWESIIIEPMPNMYWFLRGRFYQDDRVTLVNKAMAGKTGPRKFYLGGNPASSSLLEEKTNISKDNTLDVECIEASSFFRGIKGKVVVNLNCEGAELEVMENLMDSGAYKDKIFFYSTHKNCVLDIDRYDRNLARMKELGVEFVGGTYGTLRNKALESKISIPEQLKIWGKESWSEWLKGGPNE